MTSARTLFEDKGTQIIVCGFERKRQIFAVDFFENTLDRTVVQIDDVFEDEQQVLDFKNPRSPGSRFESPSRMLRSVSRSTYCMTCASD